MSPSAPTAGFRLPHAALEWLVGASSARVLTLSGAGLPRALHRAGHRVFAVDTSQEVVSSLREGGIAGVVAQAESLPLDPCVFDVVMCHQVFHRYAPGLVLSEMARVLRPGGHASVSYLVRDDSVPWVRRLVALVRDLDPGAMSGDFGADSVQELVGSKYFPSVEHKEFRHWVAVSRRGMVDMVGRLPAVRGLAESEREPFLGAVAALYEASAAGADNLRLPYQLRCWRAHVDHQELTAPIVVDDDGLVIPL